MNFFVKISNKNRIILKNLSTHLGDITHNTKNKSQNNCKCKGKLINSKFVNGKHCLCTKFGKLIGFLMQLMFIGKNQFVF